MGAFVFFDIDGADLYFPVGDVLLLHGQEHIGPIFEPVPLDLAEGFDGLPGDGPKSGLGVGDLHAAENSENGTGGIVAEPAARGYCSYPLGIPVTA